VIDLDRLRLRITSRRDSGRSSGHGGAVAEVKESFSMEHAAEADLLRSARDRVVNFPHANELEHLHPVHPAGEWHNPDPDKFQRFRWR
jgi:hypothetical protein